MSMFGLFVRRAIVPVAVGGVLAAGLAVPAQAPAPAVALVNDSYGIEADSGLSHPAQATGNLNVEAVAYTTHASGGSTTAAQAVRHALGKLGAPYRWGGNGPSSFDCSGLVNWAFDQVGVDLPRTSRALSRTGTAVSRGDLQPGDLVFFYSPVSHVGIYIGNGQMVHASTSGKPVLVADIDGRPYHSARRVA